MTKLFLPLFILATALFAYEPLTDSQMVVMDQALDSMYGKELDDEFRQSVKDDLSDLKTFAEQLIDQKLYEKAKIFAVYIAQHKKVKRHLEEDAFRVWSYATLAEISPEAAQHFPRIVYRYYDGDGGSSFLKIEDVSFRNVFAFTARGRQHRSSLPSFLWDLAVVGERYREHPLMASFLKETMTWLELEMRDPEIFSYIGYDNLRDFALASFKDKHSERLVEAIYYTPQEEQIVAYALSKDSLDVFAHLCAFVMNEYAEPASEIKGLNDVYDSRRNFIQQIDEKGTELDSVVIQEQLKILQGIYALDTTHLNTRILLLYFYAMDKDWDAYLAMVDSVLADMPEKNSERWEGVSLKKMDVLFELKQYEEAIAVYKSVKAVRPYLDNTIILFNVYRAYDELKQYKNAYTYLYEDVNWTQEKWLNGSTLSWNFGVPASWTALMAGEFEELKKIEGYYDDMLFETPSNHSMLGDRFKIDSVSYGMTMANIGHAYLVEGDVKEALRYYTISRDVFIRNFLEGEEAGLKEFSRWMLEDWGILRENNYTVKKTRKLKKKLGIVESEEE